MVAQGGHGPWHPRGSGLLVAVVALSVLALLGHGVVALRLLNGTVHRPASDAPVAAPAPAGTPASTGSVTSSGPASLRLDHSCLIADNPPTSARIPAGDPFGTDLSPLGSGAQLQRLYEVQGLDIAPIDGAGPVRDCDRQLWTVVLTVIPSFMVRTYLKEFLVFDADRTSKGNDVADGALAAADDTDASRWRLSIAPNAEADVDVAVTVAHELGHLVSLNADQLATPQPASCDTIDVGQGCLGQTSYLVEYLSYTWSDDEVQGWKAANDITDDAKRDEALDAFYRQHSTSFVDAYAASDPVEDFAESFGLWCAFDKDNPARNDFIQGDPTDGQQKFHWFDTGSSNFYREVHAGCQALQALTH